MVSLEKSTGIDKAVPVKKSYFLLRNLMSRLRSVCLQRYSNDPEKLGADIAQDFEDNERNNAPFISTNTLLESSVFLSWVSERDTYQVAQVLPQGTGYTLSNALWALHEYEQRYHDDDGDALLVDGMTTLQREAMAYAKDLMEDKSFNDVWESVQWLYNEHEGATFKRLVTLLFDVRDALRRWQWDGLEIINTDVV